MTSIQERIAKVLRRHIITNTPTWANERICLCGKTVRVMPPGPDFPDHVAEVLTTELELDKFDYYREYHDDAALYVSKGAAKGAAIWGRTWW